MIKKNRVYIVILFIAVSAGLVYSQFLIDDSYRFEQKQKSELPEYIARNIKAEIVDEVTGAVRIRFNVAPTSKNVFLVGRTTQHPTPEIALKATTVKVVLPGAEPMAIDSNLPPGQYYYVVLAREKILEKDIQLYPDVNYTSTPIIIKSLVPEEPKKRAPEQVTLLYARVVNKTQVLLTWKGVQQPNVVYKVYRSNEQLNTPEKVKKATLISQVPVHRESFIDRMITRSGKYYYAITVQDSEGNEDFQLIPDQNYTTTPVSVIIHKDVIVSNIKAVTERGVIKITWSKPEVDVVSYEIYRYTQPIANAHILALATKIATVPPHQCEFIDPKPLPGEYYFAVLAILEDGSMDTNLLPNSNYTTAPVVIGEPIRITSIDSVYRDGKVVIRWTYKGSSGDRYYKLFRTHEKPNSISDLYAAYLVDVVDVTTREYIDKDVPQGNYYYVLVPESFDIDPNFTMEQGVHYTLQPVNVIVEKKKLADKESHTKQPEKKAIDEKPKDIKDQKEKQKEEQKLCDRILSTPNVNKIIASTFYKEKYRECIDMLTKFIATSDNTAEVAKAHLYIGRSYIELKNYKKAIRYLLRKDVMQCYPKEAQFWSKFAISKIQ